MRVIAAASFSRYRKLRPRKSRPIPSHTLTIVTVAIAAQFTIAFRYQFECSAVHNVVTNKADSKDAHPTAGHAFPVHLKANPG